MRFKFRQLPSHPDFQIGIQFADWERQAVNGNSFGMFIWVSSAKGRPDCQELLLRDGDHCIARKSTFSTNKSVLTVLCPDKVDSSIFVHLCLNRLILRNEGNISVLVTDEFGKRHHLGTIEFRENFFSELEKPTIDLKPRPILISSLGRSGSTVLANSIGLHPEVSLIGGYPFEYRFFSYCLHATYVLTSPGNQDFSMGPDSFEKVNLFNTGFNPYNCREFDRQLENNELRNFYETSFCHDTIEYFMLQAKAAIEKATSGKSTAIAFIEKSAGTNLCNLAENIFPNLREIVLIRDFWDMALSMIAFDLKRGTKSFYAESPDEWLIARAFQHGNLRIRSRIAGKIPVMYEDMIKNPKSCLFDLTGKLGLRQDTESINKMLEPFNNPEYLKRHQTSIKKKTEIKKWFSKEAIKATELLLSDCESNQNNNSYTIATWPGDNATPLALINEGNSRTCDIDPIKVQWTEAFAWATYLNDAVKRENDSRFQINESELNTLKLRASRAESYAKTLEEERLRLNESLKLKDMAIDNAIISHNTEIAALNKNAASQIQSYSDRASRAEVYCASLQNELEKYKKLLALEKSKLREQFASDETAFMDLMDSNSLHVQNNIKLKTINRELEKQILNQKNRAETAEKYASSLEEELKKIKNEWAAQSDHYAAQFTMLINNLDAFSERANKAEAYAKSLEIERIKLNESYTGQYNLRIEDQKRYVVNIKALEDRAAKSEEYSKSLELEVAKLKNNY